MLHAPGGFFGGIWCITQQLGLKHQVGQSADQIGNIGRRDHQRAAGLQHTVEFLQGKQLIRQMLDAFLAYNDIDRVVWKRQAFGQIRELGLAIQ
ncbi:hypothetical protein HMPREF3069_14605 [Achromobacter xylosoxidans]|nr:hypothetical protein HMPREF3069_14605 [Achromobacter xylosoxidans]